MFKTSLQTMNKTPAKLQKDGNKTVGGVVLTNYTLRHHGTVLLRTFWPAAAHFFKNLITFQQIGTSTHFLPCLTPHRSQNLAN